jgi:hypothetical protein
VLQPLKRGRGLVTHLESAVCSMKSGIQMEAVGELRLLQLNYDVLQIRFARAAMPEKETEVESISQSRDTKVFGVILSSLCTLNSGCALLHDILQCAGSRNAGSIVVN